MLSGWSRTTRTLRGPPSLYGFLGPASRLPPCHRPPNGMFGTWLQLKSTQPAAPPLGSSEATARSNELACSAVCRRRPQTSCSAARTARIFQRNDGLGRIVMLSLLEIPPQRPSYLLTVSPMLGGGRGAVASPLRHQVATPSSHQDTYSWPRPVKTVLHARVTALGHDAINHA